MKEMSVEKAKEILEQAKKASRIDPSDGLVISTGEGPSFAEIAEATKVLERAGGKKKEMSVEEAREVLKQVGKAMRIDPSDGLVVATGEGPGVAEIVEACKVVNEAEFKKPMSLWEAKDILRKDQEHTSPDGFLEDGKGPAPEKVHHAVFVIEQEGNKERESLRSGTLRPKDVEALSQKEAYDVLRQNAQEERRKPLLKRLFSKKERPFYWENSMEWEDVKFESPKGQILFSHRIDLEYLTPDQEKQVREGLQKRNIRFEERNATHDDGVIRKGDRTFRIKDAESVEKLRSFVFHWASQGRPVSMSLEEYNSRKVKAKPAKPYVLRHATPISPEPERPFNWRDSMCWQDVKFQSNGEILFSHRVGLEGLTPEQEKEMKEGLAKYHINYEERKASFDDGKIKAGDRTLRISDKKSIEQLRAMVFNWVQGGGARPVSMPISEYQAQQTKRAAFAAKQSAGK